MKQIIFPLIKSKPSHKIPFCSPGLRFQLFEKEIQESFRKTLKSHQYISGQNVAQFEEAFSHYIGVKESIAVNSCTDAISLTLLGMGIKKGDEVITSGLTAPATIVGIINSRATPIVVDITTNNHTIDPSEISKHITPKTKAIIPVHLHGFAADMVSIVELAEKYGLFVIEDCAQAHGGTFSGQRLGSIGHAGVFSFYPTKNLGCMGDGGAIVTDDESLADKIKSLRNYGFKHEEIEKSGFNSRMDEVQAAILITLLSHLDSYNAARRKWAEQYFKELRSLPITLPPIKEGAVYHQFPIRIKDRDRLKIELENKGLLTGIHYNKCIADHPAFQPYCRSLTQAKLASKELLSFPIQPEILEVHFEEIIQILKDLFV